MFKKILKSIWVKACICKLAYYYIKLVYKINNWQVIYPENADFLNILKQQAIYSFWHGRLIMMPMMPHFRTSPFKMNVLISGHRDGDMIARVISHFNFATISGSSSKNSRVALREILSKIKSKEDIAITPDGPRGPACKINSNIIGIARMTGVPIIPMSFSCARHYRFRSWDRFMLPKIWGKGVLVYGRPIYVAKDSSAEEISKLEQELELEMNSITAKADLLVGV